MRNINKRNLYILVIFHFSLLVNAQSFYKEVPFEVQDSKMYVEALLNNKPYRFLVDTGASGYGRVDSELVSQLNIPIIGTDTNYDGTNRASIDVVKVESLSFAGITFENVRLLSRDYNRRPNPNKKRHYGVIGQRFWQDYVMEIDYERKKLIFSDIPLSKKDENTISYKRLFIVPFQVGAVEVQGHVDTGSPFTILFPTKYTEEFEVSELREVGTARSANTTFTYSIGTIKESISIADNELDNLTGVFSEIIGHVNIGMAFLKNFHVKIDQKNKLIQLQKIQK